MTLLAHTTQLPGSSQAQCEVPAMLCWAQTRGLHLGGSQSHEGNTSVYYGMHTHRLRWAEAPSPTRTCEGGTEEPGEAQKASPRKWP